MSELAKEYIERKTKEAKLAKDADLIDQILLLREYEWMGNKEATKGIYTQKPSSWWNKIWTSEGSKTMTQTIFDKVVNGEIKVGKYGITRFQTDLLSRFEEFRFVQDDLLWGDFAPDGANSCKIWVEEKRLVCSIFEYLSRCLRIVG